MAKTALALIGVAAAGAFVAAAYGQESGHSTLVGAAFGAASYEAFGRAEQAMESSYNVGFRLGVDFYRNDRGLTHLVSLDLAATEGYFGLPIKIFDFNYNLPIYFTSGMLQPAVRPSFGARFATGDRGGSVGELGILGGVRFKPSPTKCIFTDLYAGWLGRYGTLPFETAFEPDGWKSGFAFRNANTIEIVAPVCIYITAALDYDFTKVEPLSRKEDPGTRKPVFRGGFGPAFTF